MLSRSLALLCAAAMLASLFMPWMTTPLGENLVPVKALQDLDGRQVEQLLGNAPPEVWVFVGSFALAALFLLLGVMGAASRALAILTGAAPVGLVAWAMLSATQKARASGLPFSGDDLSELFQQAVRFLGFGAWAWIGGATVLLLLGLFDPGRRKA